MKVLKFSFLFFTVLIYSISFSQQTDTLSANAKDSLTIKKKAPFFLKGTARYMFIQTDNAPKLEDDFANGLALGLKVGTQKLKYFQYVLSCHALFNIFSSDLTGNNRYEIGMFDINDPNNKYKLFRLEELYMKINLKKSHVTLGSQILNTPFINPQDGRLRPSVELGIWTVMDESSFIKIEGGWLIGMLPRSTVKWEKVENSIGIYPQGVNELGNPSNYKGNLPAGQAGLKSKGVGLLGITTKKNKHIKIQEGDTYIENT